MSLPTTGAEQHLPPQNDVEAAAEQAFDAEDRPIDEDAIKESPLRTRFRHNTNEPRPLGEVMDEIDRTPSPDSPTLRHPRGRLERKTDQESAASATTERPSSAAGLPPGDETDAPVTPTRHQAAFQATGQVNGLEETNAVDEPNSLNGTNAVEQTNGLNGTDAVEQTNSLDETDAVDKPDSLNGTDVVDKPDSLNGTDAVDNPNSRNGTNANGTSRGARLGPEPGQSSNGTDEKKPAENGMDKKKPAENGMDKKKPAENGMDKKKPAESGMDRKKPEPGNPMYENVQNKSGENLASIKPGRDYLRALQQREDKPPISATRPRRARRDSELVSGRRAGAGWSRSAIRWAPLNVPLQRRLQTLLVLLHTLSIVGGLALFFVLCAVPILWPILLPYSIYLLLSRASVNGKLALRSERLRSSKIWSLFASYFPARLHRSRTLEPTRKYIFGYHPHGIISHGAFAAFATEALGFRQLFPGITNTLLTLDSNFRIPIYRDYALRMGLASVSRESCENILTKGGTNGEGMGRAITIVIGGARESLDAMPYSLRLVLKRRKGFVKLAIRTGADLVPVLAFGENDLYDQFDAGPHPYVHQAQMLVKKFLGFTIPLFHARGVFNYDVGMMPYRRPLNIVVGKPIRVMHSKTPDPAYVDQIHSLYAQELVRIWDDWKDTFAIHRQEELQLVE